MDRRVRTTVFVFIAASIGVLGLALGLSFNLVEHTEIMNLFFLVIVTFLLFGNTLLLYAIANMIEKEKE